MKKAKKEKKIIDLIILFILIALVFAITLFAITQETSNQKIVLIEIYKCAGPNISSSSMAHYYIYQNTNVVEIRNANSNGSNNIFSKTINQNLIDNFKNSLDEYIAKNPTINTGFHKNERYTIEYNGLSIIVPNPSVASSLGFDPNEYTFYSNVENFINTINN